MPYRRITCQSWTWKLEDLDTKPGISLNEITTGIAGLYLDDVDKLAAQLADLTFNDKRPGESFALDVDVVGMSIDPPAFEESVWAPPLPMAGPSVWQANRVVEETRPINANRGESCLRFCSGRIAI